MHSTFVRVRCPTATTLIEIKQLRGVANDLLTHRTKWFAQSARMVADSMLIRQTLAHAVGGQRRTVGYVADRS
jgi:hypothetical protein